MKDQQKEKENAMRQCCNLHQDERVNELTQEFHRKFTFTRSSSYALYACMHKHTHFILHYKCYKLQFWVLYSKIIQWLNSFKWERQPCHNSEAKTTIQHIYLVAFRGLRAQIWWTYDAMLDAYNNTLLKTDNNNKGLNRRWWQKEKSERNEKNERIENIWIFFSF